MLIKLGPAIFHALKVLSTFCETGRYCVELPFLLMKRRISCVERGVLCRWRLAGHKQASQLADAAQGIQQLFCLGLDGRVI